MANAEKNLWGGIPEIMKNYFSFCGLLATLGFMCGSCHIRNVLIGVEYRNCHQMFLFAIRMGPIQSKLIHIFVTYGLASL